MNDKSIIKVYGDLEIYGDLEVYGDRLPIVSQRYAP